MSSDIAESVSFLRKLWSYKSEKARCFAIVWIKESGSRNIGYRHFCREEGSNVFDLIEEWYKRYADQLIAGGFDIYFQVLPLYRRPPYGRGAASDVKVGKWLWCDLDFKREVFEVEIDTQVLEKAKERGYFVEEKEDRELHVLYRKTKYIWYEVNRPPLRKILELSVEKIGTEPTIVVDSGNGYHLYYELERELDSSSLIIKEQSVVDLLNGDQKSKDLARILRLPGTPNQRNMRRAAVIFESNSKFKGIAPF